MNREQQIRMAVASFAEEMQERMLQAMDAGKTGWDDARHGWDKGKYATVITRRIRRHARSEHFDNEADDANYLMMLWYLRMLDRNGQAYVTTLLEDRQPPVKEVQFAVPEILMANLQETLRKALHPFVEYTGDTAEMQTKAMEQRENQLREAFAIVQNITNTREA